MPRLDCDAVTMLGPLSLTVLTLRYLSRHSFIRAQPASVLLCQGLVMAWLAHRRQRLPHELRSHSAVALFSLEAVHNANLFLRATTDVMVLNNASLVSCWTRPAQAAFPSFSRPFFFTPGHRTSDAATWCKAFMHPWETLLSQSEQASPGTPESKSSHADGSTTFADGRTALSTSKSKSPECVPILAVVRIP